MTPRSPLTAGGAFCRVKDILDAKAVAQFLDIPAYTLYRRCDAQTIAQLDLKWEQMDELDAMCREKCGETPLTDFHNKNMGAKPRAASSETLESAGLELAREVGEVAVHIIAISQSGARGMSNRKVVELLTELQDVRRCVSSMEAIVEKAGSEAA